MEEELLELDYKDARMLLDYIAGDSHLVDMDEFNVLVQDMQEFVDDCDDEEYDTEGTY